MYCLQVAIMYDLMDDLTKQELTMEDVLRTHLRSSAALAAATMSQTLASLTADVETFFVRRTLRAGEALFEQGSEGNFIYVVLSGSIASIVDFLRVSRCVLDGTAGPVTPWLGCRSMLEPRECTLHDTSSFVGAKTVGTW
jgi:hypothetical protein